MPHWYVHAFTGCDTVSAFAGGGKFGALTIVKQSNSFQEMFNRLAGNGVGAFG